MTDRIETLGLIAGDLALPLVLAREARAAGVRRIVAIGFQGMSNRDLEPLVDTMIWLRLGQTSKMIATFQEHGVRHCVMVGKIAPKSFLVEGSHAFLIFATSDTCSSPQSLPA